MNHREEALRSRLTSEFLDTLIEAIRVVGWGVDFIEVHNFLTSVFEIAGKSREETLNIIPYPLEEEGP